jgi:hypothetical protein
MSEAPGRVEAVGGLFIWCYMATKDDPAFLRQIAEHANVWFHCDLSFLWIDADRPYPFGEVGIGFPRQPADRRFILEKIRDQLGQYAANVAADLPIMTLH